MSDASNSQAVVKSILERILRIKAEKDALSEDEREVYAEAKSNGFDKTALGNAITAIRKREKDPQKYIESGAILDIYLAAYYGSGTGPANITARTHTHAPARSAAQRETRIKPQSLASMGDEPAAVAREPVLTGSGEVQGRSEPTSPPIQADGPAVDKSPVAIPRKPAGDINEGMEIPASLRRY